MIEPLSLQALAEVHQLWAQEKLSEMVAGMRFEPWDPRAGGIAKDFKLAQDKFKAATLAYQYRKEHP